MTEIPQKPPVLDLETLLRPLEGENPSGESLRYSGLYDEIAEARRADDALNKGEWQSETKVADYRKVIELAVPALATRSKDLQVAAWLSEALIKEHGFTGLRDGLKLLTGLQREFWDTLFPEIDEGDQEGRANAITWFDTQGSLAVLGASVLDAPGFGFIGFEDSKRFDFPDNIESLETAEQTRLSALKTQAEAENRITADMWRKAKAQTRRAFCEELNLVLEECAAALVELDGTDEEKYDRNQTPGLSNLKKALDSIKDTAKKILEEKRIEEPDPADLEVAEEGGEGGQAGTGRKVATGAIQNRSDALRRLADIAMFFRTTEPHSPISHLVERAVKWGNMPLENWLQDVIKDEAVIYQLRQTLGFNTTTDAQNNNEGQ